MTVSQLDQVNKESTMERSFQSGEEAFTACEAEAAEAVFARQPEDHTLPAMQVLGEQRDSVVNGLGSCVFIP